MSSRPQSQRDPAVGRDEEAVRKYIESLALTLTQLGMQRMSARVFAALAVSDDSRLTAAELSEQLSVSPAAISGAVRYLDQVGMIVKERLPGERRDHYRLYDDFWFASTLKRDRMIRMWRDATVEGIDAVGPDSPAGVRLSHMVDFLDFLIKEIPLIFERWEQLREQREHPPEG
ncbi:MarR family transcriptional regulator [Prauserella marina]|uniref:DNA-binding transcriptional regulator GbsR, MarR family n=1 Tax=Prauserella marina TaxID=530584 RepID=A0A222VXT8_9PSEU|nr:MarR family transcriptional regulator [Prauserella marina]ASR38493.1 MarR family transcriptional regulator [Prauserella marina]PWV81786.1 DNA-binding transcriptional regulator GbsR (MarR family) [Prauserella marina]SDD12313.1 DNA-binding transcriptional regulator GbsR, MarR family [Prauserella marina]